MHIPFSEDELIELVKKNGEASKYPSPKTLYYVRALKRVERGSFLFNFPACFFGSIWFLYRKMYLFALIAFFCASFFPISNLILGLFANHIYFYFLKEQYLDGARHMGTLGSALSLTILSLICFPFMIIAIGLAVIFFHIIFWVLLPIWVIVIIFVIFAFYR